VKRFLLQRLSFLALSVFGAFTIAFLVMRLIPGDPAQVMLGDYATKESIAQLRETLGLERPVWMQYVSFVGRALRGDFGQSLVTQRPAFYEVFAVFAPTMQLAAAGALVSMLLGIPAGILAAARRNRPLDYLTTTLALSGMSMPVFWLGLLLLFLFSFTLGWTPTIGAGAEGGWLSTLHHILLPALALGLSLGAMVTRMTRSAMLEVIRQDYIRTAWAKGLSSRVVVLRHALRNALIPVLTILGPLITGIITGSVVIEFLFGIPGLGKEFVTSILSRDYNVVIGVFTFYAALVGLANLAVDLLYPVLDPRIRY
jgi:peptide/nickel transport system permease protein